MRRPRPLANRKPASRPPAATLNDDVLEIAPSTRCRVRAEVTGFVDGVDVEDGWVAFRGWAAHAASGHACELVLVFDGAELVCAGAPLLPRTDLREVHPAAVARGGFRLTAPSRRVEALRVVGVWGGAASDLAIPDAARTSLQSLPPDAAFAPPVLAPADPDLLVPILVDGTGGRSGTTILMQLLAGSESVALDRTPPYENAYFRVLAGWARALAHGEWPAGLLEDDPQLASSGDWTPPRIGHRTLVRGGPPQFWESAFRAAWAEFSRTARLNAGLPGARYHVEKSYRTWKAALPTTVQPLRICLVRDPRDIWLSILDFDRKRGFPGFGRKGQPEDEYRAWFAGEMSDDLAWCVSATAAGAAVLVRYEDLITQPAREVGRLEELLETRLDASIVEAPPLDPGHLTAGSAKASVGRWEREMEPHVAAVFERELGEQLEALGYRVT